MQQYNNEHRRFGSGQFIKPEDPALKACFKKTPDSLFVGFMGHKPLYWNGMGGVLVTAGARGGKLRDLLSYTILNGQYAGTLCILDMKGELAAISQRQTRLNKHCIYWNPLGLHRIPKHRVNPVDYIRIDSHSLVSDVKVLCENMISLTGSANGDYFERRAREFLEAVILTLVKLDGELTLPRLYEIINLIPGNSDRWLDFAFEMQEAGFEISARIEEEIAANRSENTSGMKGILGEIFKSFSALSDPVLMASVSPPYDFSLSKLCESSQAYNFYMMPPAEFIDAWGPVIKALFVGAMIYKSRAPSAPRQTWILDECAQLNSFPLIVKLFSYGAGIGVRPVAVYQSADQMNQTGRGARNIITSSAAVQISFAIRDIDSATALSKTLGYQTLEYDDELAQSRDEIARKEAIRAVMEGQNPMEAGMRLSHHRQASEYRSQQQRLLMNPDEILRMPPDKAIAFIDALPFPAYMDRKPYYEQRYMAGLFHPNPYHPPADRVRVKTFFGYRTRKIISEPVPPHLQHLTQYVSGTWSYVEGYK